MYMKQCSRCKTSKPLEEFYKRKGSSDGRGYWCKTCDKTYAPRKQASEQYHTSSVGKDRQRKYNKQYYLEHTSKMRENALRWKNNNPERKREIDYEYGKKWRVANKGRVSAATRKRQAAKVNATPAWADMSAIERIYEECVLRTELTGIKHEVDHIIPLQNDRVCGLHCENNLQVLPATENRHKWNTFDEI